MRILSRQALLAHGPSITVLVTSLTIYAATCARSVSFIDSGELAAVVHTLGVAHPTGYPLFTLLGRLFTLLPLGSEEILRLNLMSALLTGAGMAVFTYACRELIAMVREKLVVADPLVDAAAACSAGLTLAFSETVWSQALAAEVYSLHILMLALVLLVFLRALRAEASGDGGAQFWYLFAFVVGLAFTNHMTTILLAPGLIVGYAVSRRSARHSLRGIVRMAPFFLLGLTPYLYLPLRALQEPPLSWGNPATLERFLWHVSGKQYSIWIFSSAAVAGRQLESFVRGLPAEFAYAGTLVAFVGAIDLWRGHRLLATVTTLLCAVTVLYAINYDIHDIESYFLLAYVAMGLWIAVSCAVHGGSLALRSRTARRLVLGILLLVPVPGLLTHYRAVDMSRHYVVEDYTRNLFASMPEGGVVFSYQWDYWLSASYYYQLVRGERPDIEVVDKELLRRSWYLAELERRHPQIMTRSAAAVSLFRTELHKFEHGLPYNPALIQARYVGMIRDMIMRSIQRGPVYVTREIEPEFTSGLLRVPVGLVQRVSADSSLPDLPDPAITVRPFPRTGKYEAVVRRMYAEAFADRVAYLRGRGQFGRALRLELEARSVDSLASAR